jgi:hypothetical protein
VFVLRLVVGLIFLVFGLFTVLARNRIVARQTARGIARPQPAMLWIVMGGPFILLGVVWLAAAFV